MELRVTKPTAIDDVLPVIENEQEMNVEAVGELTSNKEGECNE